METVISPCMKQRNCLITASTVTIYTNGEEPEFTPEENISVNTMKIQSVEGDDLVSGIRLEPDVQDCKKKTGILKTGVFNLLSFVLK